MCWHSHSSQTITVLVCNEWMLFDYMKGSQFLFPCGFCIGDLLKGQTDEVEWILDRKSEILVSRAIFCQLFFFLLLFHANISLLWVSVSLSVNGSSNLVISQKFIPATFSAQFLLLLYFHCLESRQLFSIKEGKCHIWIGKRKQAAGRKSLLGWLLTVYKQTRDAYTT